MAEGWTTPVGVMLVAYEGGSAGDLTDPAISWSEVADSEIPGFEVPRSTVLILHAGGLERFRLWLDWAAPRRGDLAVLVVSNDVGEYRRYLEQERQVRRSGDKLDHVYVMPEALQMRHREPDGSVDLFLRQLARFARYVQKLGQPISANVVPTLWSHYFAGVRRERIESARRLYTEAMVLVTAKEAGGGRALEVATDRDRVFTSKSDTIRDFLAQDEERGPLCYPYSIARAAMHHTTLSQRIINKLRGGQGTSVEISGTLESWETVASGGCRRLAEWARVALNPDPAVRAAMYLADPWSNQAEEDWVERDDWDEDVVAFANKIIHAAQNAVPGPVAACADALVAAVDVADAKARDGDADAFLKAVVAVAELLGESMKVRHGSGALG